MQSIKEILATVFKRRSPKFNHLDPQYMETIYENIEHVISYCLIEHGTKGQKFVESLLYKFPESLNLSDESICDIISQAPADNVYFMQEVFRPNLAKFGHGAIEAISMRKDILSFAY